MENTNTGSRDIVVVSLLVAVIVVAVTQSLLIAAIVIACGLFIALAIARSRDWHQRRNSTRIRRG